MTKRLPTLKFTKLKDERRERATTALTLGLDQVLPKGLPDKTSESVVDSVLGWFQSVGRADVAEKIEVAASYFSPAFISHLLTTPGRLSSHFGDTTLVADTRRFDLVEILVKLQAAQQDKRLRLVTPGVLFTDACRNYRWRGTIFTFALGVPVGRSIRAEYLAWHPSADFTPKSALQFSVIRVQHRKNSDDRGESYV